MNTPTTHQDYQMEFVVFALESAAKKAQIPTDELYRRMEKHELIEKFLFGCYDTLHTQGKDYIADVTLEALHNWEEATKKWGGKYMIVFHGSNKEIATPLVHVGRNNLDFGKGFYVTTLQQQAKRWAETIVRLRPNGKAIVNKYDLDYDGVEMAGFAILRFTKYNEEWLDFIVANRNGESRWQQYDLIEGGIANDRVFDTIENYMSGGIDKQTALGRLRYEHPNNQICILNQKIIDGYMAYLGCETSNS